MAGNIEQLLALTVTGNASLQGLAIGRFWPDDDAFRFCREVRFVQMDDGAPVLIAADPDAWLQMLARMGAGLRLHHAARNEAGHPDRMLTGFANGGPRWLVEALVPGSASTFWEPFWEVTGDPLEPPPDRRIWSVTYVRVSDGPVRPIPPARPIADVAAALRDALEAIAGFAERAAPDAAMPHWAPLFRKAVAALEDQAPREGDPGPVGFLSGPALGLIHGRRAGWVFGGMGSWDDGAYWGDAEAEGDALSETLFVALQESVTAAANSSFRPASDG